MERAAVSTLARLSRACFYGRRVRLASLAGRTCPVERSPGPARPGFTRSNAAAEEAKLNRPARQTHPVECDPPEGGKPRRVPSPVLLSPDRPPAHPSLERVGHLCPCARSAPALVRHFVDTGEGQAPKMGMEVFHTDSRPRQPDDRFATFG